MKIIILMVVLMPLFLIQNEEELLPFPDVYNFKFIYNEHIRFTISSE